MILFSCFIEGFVVCNHCQCRVPKTHTLVHSIIVALYSTQAERRCFTKGSEYCLRAENHYDVMEFVSMSSVFLDGSSPFSNIFFFLCVTV